MLSKLEKLITLSRSLAVKYFYSIISDAHYKHKPDPKYGIRVVCISDTHDSQNKLPPFPDGDILIHAGDLTLYPGSVATADAALAWISTQKHPHKIVVGGNHDMILTDVEQRTKLLAKYPNITFLQDEVTTINVRGQNLKVYGTAFTSRNGSPAFTYPRISWADAAEGEKRVWGNIPEDVDLLVTHSPAAAHRDTVDNAPQGCPALLRVLWRVRPVLHVHGHIHTGHGIEYLRFTSTQAAYERVWSRVGSWFDFLRVVIGAARTVVLGPEKVHTRGTIIANVASHLHRGDNVLRSATVIDI